MPFVRVRPANDKTKCRDFRHCENQETELAKDEIQEKEKSDKEKVKIENSTKQSQSSVDASIQSLWQEFRESTTMHGLKHARRQSKYKLRWIIWIVALIGMGSLLVYTVYSLFVYYKTNPTLTNINVKFVKEMSYPSITICNMSPYKRSAVNASQVMTQHLLHNSRLGVIMPPLNYSDPSYAELQTPISNSWLDDVSFDINDLFVVCVNKRSVVSCNNILTRMTTQWGKCFTYNSYEKVEIEGRVNGSMTGSATALTFYIDIKQDEYVYNQNIAAGVKVVLHDPEEEPDVYNKGFILSPGFSTYVSMRMTKYKYLPFPYKAGGDQYCIDVKSPRYKNTLKYYPFYSRTGCMLECRRDFIVGRCGCRAVTDPGNETLCSPYEIATCYYQNEVEFDSSADLKDRCNCLISCEFTTFDQSISTAVSPAHVYDHPLYSMGFKNLTDNYLEVRLYYDSLSYLNVESIPEYNTEDIVGILGGQMGIFLGASLLTLSELLEFIILSCVVVVKRCIGVKPDRKHDNCGHEFSQYSMPFVRVRPANDKTKCRDFRHCENQETVLAKDENKEKEKSDKEKVKIENSAKQSQSSVDASIQSLWQEFRESTTMHGLKHARRQSKYKLRWIIWIVALIGMGSLLVYTVYSLFVHYKTDPTLTNINVKFVKEMSYPSITICNMSPYKRSVVNAGQVMTQHLLHNSRLGVIMPPLNYSDPSYAELQTPIPNSWLDDVSFDINHLFVVCVNKRFVVSCNNILTRMTTQWGKCFTYNSYEKVETEGRVNGSMTGSATALTFYININQDEYV